MELFVGINDFPRLFRTKRKQKFRIPDRAKQYVTQHLFFDCFYASLD